METLKLFDGEYKFLNVVWELEPVNSTALCKACETRLGWKKSTTYTVLRKLCERSVLKNDNAVVTALVTRDQAQRLESGAVINKTFGGSLPAFVAAFLRGNTLSEAEAKEIRAMIEEAEAKEIQAMIEEAAK